MKRSMGKPNVCYLSKGLHLNLCHNNWTKLFFTAVSVLNFKFCCWTFLVKFWHKSLMCSGVTELRPQSVNYFWRDRSMVWKCNKKYDLPETWLSKSNWLIGGPVTPAHKRVLCQNWKIKQWNGTCDHEREFPISKRKIENIVIKCTLA